MENTNEENIFKDDLIEEDSINYNHDLDEKNNKVEKSTVIIPKGSVLIQDNVREKRIRKQKNYDDDYILFNNKQKPSLQINSNLDEYLKSDNTDFENSEVNNVNTLSASTFLHNSSNNDIRFNVGNLVWAKVSGHPWWPCMISTDYSEDNYVKLVGAARPKRMFYVEFFGPSVEHAWVTESCLIEYNGIEAFKTYAQDQVDQALTKSQKEKLAERFQLKVALTRRDHWEKAVEEADDAMNKHSIERKKILPHKINISENTNINKYINFNENKSSINNFEIEENLISKNTLMPNVTTYDDKIYLNSNMNVKKKIVDSLHGNTYNKITKRKVCSICGIIATKTSIIKLFLIVFLEIIKFS